MDWDTDLMLLPDLTPALLPPSAVHARRQRAGSWCMRALATASLTAIAMTAHAQQSVFATPPSILHTVRNGDTLEQLSRQYLGDATLWQALQSHNRVDSPYRLRPGSVLEIPMRLLRTATASVDYVQGNAQLTRPQQPAAAIQRGMPLQEGDQLTLDPQAFVSIRLADGSFVRVQAASQMQLQQLRRRGRTGSLQTVLDLQQGGVDVQVTGKPEAERRLNVITPVASTSVRGTTFHVQHDAQQGSSTSLYQGKLGVHALADAQAQRPTTPLQAGYGVAISTNGQASAITSLPAAPAADTLPQLNEDAQWLRLPLPAQPGVSAWLLQISSDPQGQQVLRNGRFQQGTALLPVLDDGSYYLQARAISDQGLVGQSTQVPLRVKAHPVPPLTQSPAPGGLLAQGEAQLQCTPVAKASNYRLQIVALENAQAQPSLAQFASPVLDMSGNPDCRFDLSALPSGYYAWRTASSRTLPEGTADAGPFSEVQTMRIAPRPQSPSAESMSTRSQGGISQLFWPAEAGQRFRLQAFDTQEGTIPALDVELDTPQWTAAGLPPGTWYVRIQVQDPSGLLSAFSPARSVQILPLVLDSFGHPVVTDTGLGLEH